MTKIELSDFLTVPEAMAALGCSRRAIYRSIKRAVEAGHQNVTTSILGRSVIPRKSLATLRKHYYPYYSEAHQAKVKEWGSLGGKQKAANAAAPKKTPVRRNAKTASSS